MNTITLERIIKQALAEDLGMGDWSSQWLFDSTTQKSGRFLAKQSGIFSGRKILEQVYTALGGGSRFFGPLKMVKHLKKIRFLPR